MDIHEQRRRAFGWLVQHEDGGNKAQAGRRIGKDSSYVGRLLSKPGATGHRNIEATLTQAILDGYRKPPGWLDTFDPATGHAEPEKVKLSSDDQDIVVIHTVLHNIVDALTANLPAAASTFAANLRAQARAAKLSTRAGLIAAVLDIAERDQHKAGASHAALGAGGSPKR